MNDDKIIEVGMVELSADELAAMEEQANAERELMLARLEAFGKALAKSREEAVRAKVSSGVEAEWQTDRDAYNGIDVANRESVKPLSPNGGADRSTKKTTRSKIVVNITRPYVDAAAAKVSDMLMPTDEDNFSMSASPVPEIDAMEADDTPMLDAASLNPVVKMVDGPNGPEEVPYTVKDRASDIKSLAAVSAEKAKNRIKDWHVECGYHDQFRRTIESAAQIGVGILKGPTPYLSSATKVLKDVQTGQVTTQRVERIAPESRNINPDNFYPDPACGADIHRGSFTWERDTITRKDLSDLIGLDGYIEESIMACLTEGSQTDTTTGVAGKKEKYSPAVDKNVFDIWYYYGYVSHEELEAADCECEEGEYIPALVTMVNNRVIKAALNPMSTGAFPYDVFTWVPSSENWYGEGGVARQIRTAQRMLTASVRSLFDNAGLSAGPQIVMRKGAVLAADGTTELYARKIWYVTDQGENRPVSDLIAIVNIPSVQEHLQNIVQFALKMAEDTTSLPLLLQGQQGKAPDTVGGMTIISNNASTVLRRLARAADSMLIKPHINRYYTWLLEDPEVPADEKSDFRIEARGSSALVERDLHNQYLAAAVQLAANPIYELSPARTLKEYLSSLRIDVKKLEYTDEEKKAMEAAAQQSQPTDPRVITAQAAVQTAQIRAEADTNKVNASVELSREEIAAKREEAAQERQFRMAELQMQREVEMLRMANEQNISLEKIKAMLASTAMKEKNKRDLFAAESNIKERFGEGL